MSDKLPDDWFSRLKDMVHEARKWKQDEKVLLVNGVMHKKLNDYLNQLNATSTPERTIYGTPSPLTINFMTGAVEVHVIGPLQYSLYKDQNPDTTVLIVPRETWEFMCGKGPLWDRLTKGIKR